MWSHYDSEDHILHHGFELALLKAKKPIYSKANIGLPIVLSVALAIPSVFCQGDAARLFVSEWTWPVDVGFNVIWHAVLAVAIMVALWNWRQYRNVKAEWPTANGWRRWSTVRENEHSVGNCAAWLFSLLFLLVGLPLILLAPNELTIAWRIVASLVFAITMWGVTEPIGDGIWRLTLESARYTEFWRAYDAYYVTHDGSEAIRLLKHHIEKMEREFGRGHTELMDRYRTLARLEKKRGDLLEASWHLQYAIELREEHLRAKEERDDGTLVSMYLELTRLKKELGKFSEAQVNLGHAIEVVERSDDVTDLDYSCLAHVAEDLGNHREASVALRRAIDIRVEDLGPVESRYYDFSLVGYHSHLARIEHALGNTAEAIRLMQLALEIARKEHGKNEQTKEIQEWLAKHVT